MRKIIHSFSMIISLILPLIILGLSPASAAEKGYPNKPITIVIAWQPGGGADLAARALAKELQASLGQPVLVESRPGGLGVIAGDYVAKAKPDGYTMGLFQSQSCDPELYEKLRKGKASYTGQDLIPVVTYMALLYGPVSRKDAPWNNLQEFIKYVKDNPNKVKWAHPGVGHQYHICIVILSKANKLEMISIPVKGASEWMPMILGGHVEMMITSVASAMGHVEAGRMKILAVQHTERIPSMPEIPTFKELGYDLGIAPNYFALFMPKGTPDEAVKKIHDEVKKAVETPSLKEYAKKMSFALYYRSANDLISDMKKDRETIGPILEEILK